MRLARIDAALSVIADARALQHDIPRLEMIVWNGRPVTEAARALLIQRHGAIPARYLAPVESSAPADLIPAFDEDADRDADDAERGERMSG
jgi:hypothetical protein